MCKELQDGLYLYVTCAWSMVQDVLLHTVCILESIITIITSENILFYLACPTQLVVSLQLSVYTCTARAGNWLC